MDTPLGGAVVSLLLGLLLGLERQRAAGGGVELFAGIRTFPLIALAGYLGALAGRHDIPLALPAVLLAVGGLTIASYLRPIREPSGATTEVAAFLACLLGALVGLREVPLAAALAVIVALLLTLKAPLHKIAGALSEDEILAILKFGVVAVVLVPVLPREPLALLGGLTPRQLGLLVVLLSAVSLAGYLLVRLLGRRRGWALAGLLGGLVSSTAVTLSFSGQARSKPGLTRPLAAGIVLASSILYLRGLVVIGLLDRALAWHLAPRLVALFFLGLALALVQLRGEGEATEPAGEVSLGNPVELGRAAGLALLFAGVVLISKTAQQVLGTAGLWSAGVLGGLVDVDSVAVAAARLRQEGAVPLPGAAGAYLLATLSNLAFKGTALAVVGGAGLGRRVLPVFAVLAVATVLTLLL